MLCAFKVCIICQDHVKIQAGLLPDNINPLTCRCINKTSNQMLYQNS